MFSFLSRKLETILTYLAVIILFIPLVVAIMILGMLYIVVWSVLTFLFKGFDFLPIDAPFYGYPPTTSDSSHINANQSCVYTPYKYKREKFDVTIEQIPGNDL